MADQVASMPLLVLEGGAYVQFEAVDPVTGVNVAGVAAQDGTFTAIDLTDTGDTAGDVVVPKVSPSYFATEETV